MDTRALVSKQILSTTWRKAILESGPKLFAFLPEEGGPNNQSFIDFFEALLASSSRALDPAAGPIYAESQGVLWGPA